MKKKYITLAGAIFIFLTVYCGATGVSFLVNQLLTQKADDLKGAAKITLTHFSQPGENILTSPSQMKKFLDEIVKKKTGILKEKSLYFLLLSVFICLSITLFYRIITIEGQEERSCEAVKSKRQTGG